jgi:flagellum-specific ATP synthase
MSVLTEQIGMLEHAAPLELRGTVAEVRGLALRVADLPVPIGSMVRILAGQSRHPSATRPPISGEVVGFDHDQTIVMPLGSTAGIRQGDRVIADHHAQYVRVGHSLLGRVLDGMGQPIDGLGPLQDTTHRPIYAKPIDPLDRKLIDQPLATGIRAVDSITAIGRGQRVGIFASPGLGKSTLLGSMAKHTAADVSVVALVGERGREVRDFIDNTLGPEGLARSVVICATSDEPALMRIRAANVATAIAEFFRDHGLDVLLLMDSVTRFCQAQRQVGLAAGEPPATKGYPPSVFAMLPSLLERSGRTTAGSITGLYSVLVEGDDFSEPISDACRSVLDGHIQLSRRLAEKGHYPAIDVLSSISRVADDVTTREHQAARRLVVRMLSAYQEVEDLLNIGAYASGSNPDFDLAIACKPMIDQLLQQGRGEVQGLGDFHKTSVQLLAVAQQIEQNKQQLSRTGGRRTTLPPRQGS